MPYSYSVYTGNGTNDQFAVSFSYIRKEHVFASVNYVNATFTWVNSSTIQLDSVPANAARVEVRRVTPVANPLVDFTDGSTLVAADLDTVTLQQTYINQEQDDQFQDAVFINSQGLLDAGGKRITNVGDPVNAQDAATKTYVDTTTVASAGDAMTGPLAMGNNKITGLALPTADTDAVNRGYVNSIVANGIGDGDKGDIVVSGSGSVLSIDAGVINDADVNASAGIDSSKLAFLQAGTGALARTVDSKLKDVVSVKDFGAVGDGVADDTAAIQAAIVSLRANATSILDTIGGSTITAYSAGTVEFDRGVYLISPDTLRIYQDLGLTLRGKGSRRTNNAIRAATTILVSGTSSGYGIQAYRSGGRGLTIEDMDICYASAAFTGDVLDIVDCPGVSLRRVFLGTYGLTGGTRLQTARSCIRSTYDEFLHAVDCVFDGAIDGWWSDDTRTDGGSSTFGGSVTKFDSCVWYDFTQSMIRHDGNRTRTAVSLSSCVFNPISVDCVRCVDLNNIDGLHMSGSKCAGSVANTATSEWMRLANVTGSLSGNVFSSLTKSGTVGGYLKIDGNVFAGTDGLTVTSGVISGKANEFRTGTNAWTISPTADVCVDIGPDIVLSSVTRSYDIPADSALLAGRVNYDAFMDQSSSKFRNTSGRISIENVDRKSFSTASTPYSAVITDTGRRILASSGSAQTIDLPTPVPGTTLHITKVNNQTLTINCPGGVNFYAGFTAVDTVAVAASSDIGGSLSLSAYATIGWIVTSAVGTWAFS